MSLILRNSMKIRIELLDRLNRRMIERNYSLKEAREEIDLSEVVDEMIEASQDPIWIEHGGRFLKKIHSFEEATTMRKKSLSRGRCTSLDMAVDRR